MSILDLSEYYGLFLSGMGIGFVIGAFFWLVGIVLAFFVNIFSKG